MEHQITLKWASEQHETAYYQNVQFIYDNKDYEVTLIWDNENGFDILLGYNELPLELKEN
jgi:hypothetical protein